MNVFSSATDIGAEIASGATTSANVCQAYLDRIASKNALINGVMALRPSNDIMADAAASDARTAAGQRLGPLDGVPFTAKMILETAGLRTSTGYPAVDYVPPVDADVVARMKAAGMVLLGKTNGPGNPLHTVSPGVFPEVRNPYDTTRATGGSSGGCAASVAAGLTPLSVGSDGAGSLRIPASWCDAYTLKPTLGVVSGVGDIWPQTPDRPAFYGGHLTCHGPIARSVADLSAWLDIAPGPTARNPMVPPLAPLTSAPLTKIKVVHQIGVWTSLNSAAIIPALSALSGVTLVQEDINFFAQANHVRVYEGLRGVVDAAFNAFYSSINVANRDPAPSSYPYSGTLAGAEDVLSARAEEHWLRRQLESFMDDADLLAMPATAFDPLPLGGPDTAYNMGAMAWSSLTNITGNPCVVLPLGFSAAGMPFGLQLVGRHFQDRKLLAHAAEVDAVLNGFTPPTV